MGPNTRKHTTRPLIFRADSRRRPRRHPTSPTRSGPLPHPVITTSTIITTTPIHLTRRLMPSPHLPTCSTIRSRTRSTTLLTASRPPSRPSPPQLSGRPRSPETGWPRLARSAHPHLHHITSTSCTTTTIRAHHPRVCRRGRDGATRVRRGGTPWEATRPRPRPRPTTTTIRTTRDSNRTVGLLLAPGLRRPQSEGAPELREGAGRSSRSRQPIPYS